MSNRVPAPDGHRGKDNEPIKVLPAGTWLKKTYQVNYLTVGGMSIVYRGEKAGMPCFIKEVAASDTKMVVSLTQEKATLERLKHPGIIEALDFFEENGFYYLVSEFIEGKNLEQLMSDNPEEMLSEQVLFLWAWQLYEIFEYLHKQNPPIIYRDLKPQNVVRDADGRVHLVDFGIARVYKDRRRVDTEQMGTMLTASPEHFGGKQTDARSDIYTLGATFHVLLTNGRGMGHGLFEFHPLRSINPGVSEQLEHVIHKSIELNPDERYQTVEEMRRAHLKASQFRLDEIFKDVYSTAELEHIVSYKQKIEDEADTNELPDEAAADSPPSKEMTEGEIPPVQEEGPSVLPMTPRATAEMPAKKAALEKTVPLKKEKKKSKLAWIMSCFTIIGMLVVAGIFLNLLEKGCAPSPSPSPSESSDRRKIFREKMRQKMKKLYKLKEIKAIKDLELVPPSGKEVDGGTRFALPGNKSITIPEGYVMAKSDTILHALGKDTETYKFYNIDNRAETIRFLQIMWMPAVDKKAFDDLVKEAQAEIVSKDYQLIENKVVPWDSGRKHSFTFTIVAAGDGPSATQQRDFLLPADGSGTYVLIAGAFVKKFKEYMRTEFGPCFNSFGR